MFDFPEFTRIVLIGFFTGMPFGLALALGIGLPIAVVASVSILRRVSPQFRLSIVLGAIIFGCALSTALSARELFSEAEFFASQGSLGRQPGSIWGIRASQVFTILALLVSASQIFSSFTERVQKSGRPWGLYWAALLYFVLSVVVSGLAGAYREPQFNDFYFVVVILAATCLSTSIDGQFWRNIRIVLMVPIVGSLIAILVAPKLALQPGYVGSVIPGFAQRLYGLADHANALGPIAVIAIAIELCPFVRSRPSLLFLLPQVAVLLLTQSKTAWLAAIFVVPIVRLQWISGGPEKRDRWKSSLIFILLAIAAVLIVTLGLLLLGKSSAFQRFAINSDIFTLTGRFSLWGLTIDEFLKNPLLGYGPSLWDLRYRMDRGLLYAGQAHNQFVHILGQAGILGFVSMAIYLLMITRFALIGFKRDSGLSLALLVVVLMRCFTESPLRMMGIMDWENFTHLLLFCAVASNAAASLRDKPRGRAGLVPQGI